MYVDDNNTLVTIPILLQLKTGFVPLKKIIINITKHVQQYAYC